MSAWMLDNVHIDFLVSAGLHLPRHGSVLRWFARQSTPEDRAYQAGSFWGPGLSSFMKEAGRELTRETATQTGAMLLAENRRSMNFRYDEEEIEQIYEFREVAPANGAAWHSLEALSMVAKATSCYEYQACEHPEWKGSEAWDFCQSLLSVVVHSLPGWESGPGWPVDDSDVRVVRPLGRRIA